MTSRARNRLARPCHAARAGCGLALLLLGPAGAQPFVPGQTYFGGNQYTEYRAGDLPIILTAPHGGSLTPAGIPDRGPIPGQDVVTTNDANTADLVRRIADVIHERTGRHAHVVINLLSRLKLDANRELPVAAQGNAVAGAAWSEYHGFIAAARRAAQASYGFSFLVDQHGHGHAIPRLELGYNLGNATLALSDTELARPRYQWDSYLRTLPLFRPETGLPALLRGPRSLGEFFAARNFPACPSPRDPAPGDPAYFSGGYTTDTHTCITDNSPGHGVQIEANLAGVRDTAANRQAFAVAVAEAVNQFLFDSYGFVLGTGPVFRVAPPDGDLHAGGPPVGVVIARDGYRGAAETLAVAFGGTALRPIDYTAPSSVSFVSGQSTAILLVTPAASRSGPGDTTLEIALAPSSLQAAASAPVVIPFGDGRSTSVRVAAIAPRVTEAAGAVDFRLSRTDAGQALTVNLAWAGDAIAGRDYVLAPELATQARFAAGQSELVLSLPLVDDAMPRPARRVALGIRPGAGYVPGTSDASVDITDDDTATGLAVWLSGTARPGGLRDESGAGRHAAAQPAGRGPGVVTAPGGSGIGFNGVDQTLQLPRFTLDPTRAFTLAFHFRLTPGATVASQNLVSFGTRGAAGSVHVHLNSATILRTHLEDATGTFADADLDATGAWTDGTWRHYALVVDAQGGRRVFLDGTLVRSVPGWSGSLSSTEQLWLGWRPQNSAAGHFSGALADVRIYQRAITPAEVGALASGQSTFAAWCEERGLPATSTAADDPDGDGRPNAIEYALATDPNRAASVPALTLAREGTGTRLAFLRRTPAADVSLTLEASDAGGAWQTLGSLPAGATIWTTSPGISLSDTSGAVSAIDATGATSRAWRLRVEVGGVTNVFSAAFDEAATTTRDATGRIANLSIRTGAGIGEATLIVGFVVGGSGTTGGTTLLLRGAGPALAVFGVGGALADPEIELVKEGARVAANDNWDGSASLAAAFASVGAFAFSSFDRRDAALLLPGLGTGAYSVLVRGTGSTAGIALAEIYDATPAREVTRTTPRLTNVSARTSVGTGESIVITGFVVAGPAAKRVLIRAVGPTLVAFGVAGALTNPHLVVSRDGTGIATNDDWGGGAALRDTFASVGAFALPPASADAALLLTLNPGNYSAQVSGVGGTTGIALVEVYELP